MVKKMNATKTSNMLPEGWLVITKYRKRGSSKGQRDRTYYSPDMQRFRSLVAAKRFIAANTAPEAGEENVKEEKEEIEDNLIVQQQNDVVKLTIVSASSSSQALDDSSNSNDVIVIDSSSSDDDDDSLWM